MSYNTHLMNPFCDAVQFLGDYLRGASEDDYDLDTFDEHRWLKLDSAQKRQINRDKRRRKKGLTRTDAQDRKERTRKHAQATNRGKDRVDPNQPDLDVGDKEFIRKRDKYRQEDCTKNGRWACGWHAIDQDTDGTWDVDKIHQNRHYVNEPADGDNWYDD